MGRLLVNVFFHKEIPLLVEYSMRILLTGQQDSAKVRLLFISRSIIFLPKQVNTMNTLLRIEVVNKTPDT